jgi:hypothetical protein
MRGIREGEKKSILKRCHRKACTKKETLPDGMHKGSRQGQKHAAFERRMSRGARQQARGQLANEICLKGREFYTTLFRLPLYFRQRSQDR